MDWFLYDRDLHRERVKVLYFNFSIITLYVPTLQNGQRHSKGWRFHFNARNYLLKLVHKQVNSENFSNWNFGLEEINIKISNKEYYDKIKINW